MFGRLAILTSLAAVAPAAAASPRYMDVALVAETLAPRPGSSVLVGLKMRPQPGWHGYWSNAGDSGLPPTVHWTAPPGAKFGPLQHPAPTLLRVMGLTSFVHAGKHVLIARMTVDRTMASGTPLPVTVDVSFAVCSDSLCVPQRANLSLKLVAGDGKPTADAALLREAFAKQPKPLPAGLFDVADGRLTLQLPAAARLEASRTRFFPDENGFFDASRARVWSTSPLRIVSPVTGNRSKAITGVVSDGSVAFRIRFRRGSLLGDPSAALASPGNRVAPKLELPPQAPADPPVAQATDRQEYIAASRNHANRGLSLFRALLIGGAVTICGMLGAFTWLRHRHQSVSKIRS